MLNGDVFATAHELFNAFGVCVILALGDGARSTYGVGVEISGAEFRFHIRPLFQET